MFEEIDSYPLCWPAGWPRKEVRFTSAFDAKRTIARAREELINQSRLLSAVSPIISSNIETRRDGLPYSNRRPPEDPGVAVYVNMKGKPIVFACDTWDRVADNLWAIAKHIDATRGIARWGVGSLDRAFAGYALLPAGEERDPYSILGINRSASDEEIKAAYRQLAKLHHPDSGGDREEFLYITSAYGRLCREKGIK